MRRIRICQLITDLSPAGSERSVYELSRRLDRKRFDVQVVALRGGAVADWLTEAGVRVTVLGVRGKWDVFKLFALKNLLRRERIDLLHTHLFHADLAGRIAARLAAVPHIVHTVRTAEGRFRPWQFTFARFFSGYCERIICISESVLQHHMARSGLPRHKYTVITNGIDADKYCRDDNARANLRRQWGIDGDKVIVGFLGRLAPEKGVDTLLSAISHLGARGNPADVIIAGDGSKRHLVENFIAHGEGGKHCRLLGFIDDVRGLLSAVDMLVMPSRWEGWPLAAGEAMAAGLPVVGTDVPGLRDLIVHGQTGLLVGKRQAVELSEAIVQLAGNEELRAKMGMAGRQRIMREFPIEATVAAHEKLYTEVLQLQ